MIVSGGFNIYPKEIEDVLITHPAVAMAAVIGIPDERWGEAVTAVIVRKPGQAANGEAVDGAALEAELKELVKHRKGSAHAPKAIDFVDELPVTAVGKINKIAIRAPYWAGRERGSAESCRYLQPFLIV